MQVQYTQNTPIDISTITSNSSELKITPNTKRNLLTDLTEFYEKNRELFPINLSDHEITEIFYYFENRNFLENEPKYENPSYISKAKAKLPRSLEVHEERIIIQLDQPLGQGANKKINFSLSYSSTLEVVANYRIPLIITDPIHPDQLSCLHELKKRSKEPEYQGLTEILSVLEYEENNSKWLSVNVKYYSLGDLKNYLLKNTLSGVAGEKARKQITLGLIAGIKSLHAMGYVHRDIKLDNILIKETDPFSVVICDFDLTRRKETRLSAGEKFNLFDSPPEFLMAIKTGAASVDEKIDIWMLGLALAELYGIVVPFKMVLKNTMNTVDPYTGKQTKLSDHHEVVPNLINKWPFEKPANEESMSYLIYCMLQNDPDKRFSLKECEDWLTAYYQREQTRYHSSLINPSTSVYVN